MPYEVIAQGSPDQIQINQPAIDDIPPGSEIKIGIDINKAAFVFLNPSFWNPFDLYSTQNNANWWSQQLIPAGVSVDRVVSDDSGHIEVYGRANGTFTLILIAAVITAVSIFGVTWAVSQIVISANITRQQEVTAQLVTDLANQGYTPEQIQNIINGVNDVPGRAQATGLSDWLLPVGLIATAVFMLPGLLQKR